MIDGRRWMHEMALGLAGTGGLASLARPHFGGLGAIMMLHSVTATPETRIGANDHLVIDPDFLDRLLSHLRHQGYLFASMDEALERVRSAGGGARFVAFTADDAYRDNLLEALPVLERHGAPLTIYVAPGLIDGDAVLWWEVVEEVVARLDRVDLPGAEGMRSLDCSTLAGKRKANRIIQDHLTRNVPEADQHAAVLALARSAGIDCAAFMHGRLMDWRQIADIARHPLVTIGAHTVHHRNLKRLSEDGAAQELARSRAILEERLGSAPRHLAFPYGYAAAAGEREARLAGEAGFATAVTTRHGLIHAEHADHLHALPRISVNGRHQNVRHIDTMLSGITTPMANRGRRVVTV
ncbi:polysaccharide deacetylase family protein [Mesorhizobium xinjiangense]|uniref:polysaccharide deacetylase family protein n=1 Tax=Mesorhizobium xinjiangense TaxID=2678685 RepID=UPI0012ED2117|nr:polysaccharide deacetylase family protein [Mesorhizobium xinjiangense]